MKSNYLNIDISIVIVNYKSWNHLEKCVNSIQKILFENLIIEIIVVDNFSNDDQLQSFKKTFSKVNFIVNTGNNGFANGCNLGAKNAKGNYLFFLNPDTIISKDPILKMHSFLIENEDFGIVSCNQKNSDGSYEKNVRFYPKLNTLFGFLRTINKKKLKSKKKNKSNVIYPEWVSGAVVFISKKWFDKVNGWNEDYWMYFEDVDLSKKVTDLGGKIALLTNTEINHNHGGTSRVNLNTTSITKTEVVISKHVYLSNHFKGFNHFLLQFLVLLNNLFEKLILAFFGLIFFFIPKLRLKLYLFINLIKYYFVSLKYNTWLSTKSMNHPNKKK